MLKAEPKKRRLKMLLKKVVLIIESCGVTGTINYFVLIKDGKIAGPLYLIIAGAIILFFYLLLSSLAVNLCSTTRSWAYKYAVSAWDSDIKLTYAMIWPFVLPPLILWYILIGFIHRIF